MKLSKNEQSRLRQRYGDWALVSGASSGIGQAIAIELAAAGCQLVLNARRETSLKEFALSLSAKYQTQSVLITADLSDSVGVHQLQEGCEAYPIGLVVLSAGFGTSGHFVDSSLADELNMFRLNCESVLLLTHHFGQHFCQTGRGGIILLSSMVGFQGTPFAAHYAATKAYVQNLAEGLHHEFKAKGVDLLAAAPGPVSTKFEARANMRMGGALSPEQVASPILQALGRKMTVLPGWLTKVLVYSLRTVPRWTKVRIMKQVMGGMTAHQREGVEV